tara:strand:- start:295 stop:1284 length:990 start_codon:yes stop_codon:yes gene_type:complete
MIIKSFEINKINLKKNNLILLYGKNEGFKKQVINKLTNKQRNISSYEEKDIFNAQNNFLENIFNRSLFEEEKVIIIKRASDKIVNFLEEINNKNIDDIIIIEADNLEKRSKLRSFFERDKKHICVPFYPDNDQILSKLAIEYFREKNIAISQLNINQIVNKCAGDRENLYNELKKIENYLISKNKITPEAIVKLINLSENFSVSELIDNCLAKNKSKTIQILNENNYTNDDCILILRTFLNKSKKILKLSIDYEKNKNIDLTISSSKPPIFWKDKEITKKQILRWKSRNLKELIYKINNIELTIKKNLNNSLNLLSDFILEQSTLKTNN